LTSPRWSHAKVGLKRKYVKYGYGRMIDCIG
jgi:hypothetical protein